MNSFDDPIFELTTSTIQSRVIGSDVPIIVEAYVDTP